MPKHVDPETGIWDVGADSKEHKFDPHVANSIFALLLREKASNIMDFGCGNGAYVTYLRDVGLSVQGCDGNPHTATLTGNTCSVQDLSKEFHWPHSFDWNICLEVGEHIPKECEKTFLDNLVVHTEKGIIMSWALPGQGGCGHVNEQANPYVITEMAKRGFIYDHEESLILREVTHWWWFKNTLMVFRK